ncbi:MAG: dynamin family protein [Planctomycetaceae bacterium]
MTTKTQRVDMAERIEQAKKQVKDKGCGAIAGLEKVTTALKMDSLCKQLKTVRDDFAADTFKLMIVGRFKTGKSTLINAILGKPRGGRSAVNHGPMPVDDLPATAVLTSIDYSETPFVNAWDFEGRKQPWTFERYHREAVLRTSEKETRDFFKDIRQFEVGYPAELLRSGLTLMDSAGTDEHPNRTAITVEGVRRCDAVIVAYRHDSFAGETERQWVADNILGTGIRMFNVVNLWNGRTVDDRLRQLAWDKLVRELQGGDDYQGQEFSSQEIYFVDAKRAFDAHMTDSFADLDASGLAQLQQRLTDFLLKERYVAHVERFLKATENHAGEIRRELNQRRAALKADREKLLEAAKTIQPKLDVIQRRRDKLPAILTRYRRECARELSISFEHEINKLRLDLLEECKQRPLKSLSGVVDIVKSHFSRKRVSEEAAEICMAVIKQRIDTWAKNPADEPGAQQVIEPILRRMIDEIADEVASIRTEFKNLHLGLTGWQPDNVANSKDETLSRLMFVVGGVLLGDVGVAMSGSFRGLAGTFAGYLAGGLLAAVLGLSAPVALPALIVAGLLGGIVGTRLGLEDRIWKQTCDKADEQLRKLPDEARPKIEQEAETTFAKIEDAVFQDVDALIAQETQNIQQVLDLNKQDQSDKDKSLKALDAADKEVADRCKELQDVLLLAKQAK